MFSLNSCASLTTTTLIGNVTAYNDDGTILRKWDNVTIKEEVNTIQTESMYKTFGFNFYDKNNDKFIIIGNAVPCIVEYNVINKSQNSYNKPSREELSNQWKTLDNEYNSIHKQMKMLNKHSDEYNKLNEKRKVVQDKKNDVVRLMYKHYYTFIR